MRISDWSSDVCSSDLLGFRHVTYADRGCRTRPALEQIASLAHSAVAEGVAIPVDRGNAAKMDVKHFRTLRKVALADQIDHALHRLAFVNRVRDHTFEPRRKSDRLQGFLRRYAVRGISIVLLDNDVLVDNLVATNEGRRVPGDVKHLRTSLGGREGRINAEHVPLDRKSVV